MWNLFTFALLNKRAEPKRKKTLKEKKYNGKIIETGVEIVP